MPGNYYTGKQAYLIRLENITFEYARMMAVENNMYYPHMVRPKKLAYATRDLRSALPKQPSQSIYIYIYIY